MDYNDIPIGFNLILRVPRTRQHDEWLWKGDLAPIVKAAKNLQLPNHWAALPVAKKRGRPRGSKNRNR